MATNEIAAAARAICEEKGISLEAVIDAIESALAAAYRKDYGEKNQNIKVEFDLETASSKIYDEKTVVEDMPPEEEDEQVASDNPQVTTDEQRINEKEEKKVKSQKPALSADRSKVKSTTVDDAKNKKEENKKSEDDSKTGSKEDVKATEGESSFAKATEGEEEIRRFNPRAELQLSDAKKIKKSYKVGDIIKTELKTPSDYGRMAAQTAKQVIIQRIREVERTNMFDEFKDKEHEVVTGIVQRREGRVILVDLGRTNGILTSEGQVMGERYEPGQRIKVYVEEVRSGAKGPEIILSRASVEVVRKIFLSEIPEIANGLVEIKAVAREAGSRSKIAVHAAEDNVDPIGSCVGQRGARISTIIGELGGEKIDIIQYSDDPAEFIKNALSPAKAVNVKIDENKHIAIANVAADQLSLAIGRGGQNVRLAARLTGWKIDVRESKSKKDAEKGADDESKDEKKANGEENSEEQIVNGEPSFAKAAADEEKPKKRGRKSEKAKVKSEKEEEIEREVKSEKE